MQDDRGFISRCDAPAEGYEYFEMTFKPDSPLARFLVSMGLPASRPDLKCLLGRWCILEGWIGDSAQSAIWSYAKPIAERDCASVIPWPSLRLLNMATGWEDANELLPIDAIKKLRSSPEWLNFFGSEQRED